MWIPFVMQKMLLAQKQGNTEKMTMGAHHLKGVAGNIGFQCLFELLDTIELEGDRGALVFSQQEYEKVTDLVARSLEEVSRKHPDLTRDI
jgi:HPt (histidine-containing phosphotransfer) domain-containing protein